MPLQDLSVSVHVIYVLRILFPRFIPPPLYIVPEEGSGLRARGNRALRVIQGTRAIKLGGLWIASKVRC